jgi:hypothetical protein
MLVSIEWALKNPKKAYRIHHFEGSYEQFCEVIKQAEQNGIKHTKDIPEELIKSITQ